MTPAPHGRSVADSREVDSGTATLTIDGTRATVHLDGIESSSIDLAHPERLEFEYMQHIDVGVDTVIGEGTAVRALHLGGAGCALPWAWHLTRPGSRQVAVEIDARLAEVVREWFDLPRAPHLRIRVADGRDVLDTQRPGAWDVVVRDAFAHGRVPAPLATLEAHRAAVRALRPGGLLALNSAHGGGADARPDAAALVDLVGADSVAAVMDPKVGRQGRYGNVVLLAVAPGGGTDEDGADSPGLDIADLDRRLRRLPLPARPVTGGELLRWIAGARPLRDPAPTD